MGFPAIGGDFLAVHRPLRSPHMGGWEDTRGMKCALGAMSQVLGVGWRKCKGPWRKTVEG